MVLKTYRSWHWLMISAGVALFIIYPDITWLPFELEKLASAADKNAHILFFGFRYLFFTGLLFMLVQLNLHRIHGASFPRRLGISFMISIIAYCLYGGIFLLIATKLRHFGSLLLFQVFILALITSLLGHIILLYHEKRKKELQIEELTLQNLQTRYDALMNQINPHFFFNSLNGLTSLIRKKNEDKTLDYVNKLSDVFRYILQSDQRGLVSLKEELEFVYSFRYMMEVRFANKLQYNIQVSEDLLNHRLPVLSILPVLDNVVVHNMIDSDHRMVIDIYTNENEQLVITNPIYPKLTDPHTNGTGLKNLAGRCTLLMGKSIQVEQKADTFTIYIPLKAYHHEDTYCGG